jgi:adenylate cyclase
MKQTERAKQRMDRALLIEPDNLNMRYNFGCALSVHLDEAEAAVDMLEPVMAKCAAGFFAHAKADPDLDKLREQPRFKKMIADAEARLAGTSDAKA